jgi:hypothetical protein
MKEEYLHYLWKTKNIPQQNLRLTDGRPITISAFGFHNKDSGPDFSNAKIEIDGISWYGNIEIHIKSSDWYAHKHQFDKAYENVILHVVFEYDKPVFFQSEEIPTLELNKYFERSYFNKFEQKLNKMRWIPCEDSLNKIDNFFWKNQLDFSVFQRLERRVEEIAKRYKEINFDLNRLIIEYLASVLGTKTNRIPMIELIQKIPSSVLLKESNQNIEAILLEVAQLLPEESDNSYVKELKTNGRYYKNKYQLTSMNRTSWKYFGIRPSGFPPFRIVQLAKILSNSTFFEFLTISVEEWLHWFWKTDFIVNEFWKTHYHFESETKMHNTSLSKETKNLILINVVVPIMYWWGVYQHNEKLTENAFELLELCKPENNAIIQNWRKIGVYANSAKETQGLLELKNEFCNKKKCLSCKIGHQVLNL